MKTIESITQEETNEIVCEAHAWRTKHSKHVSTLVRDADRAYPPSGSDMWHPELWKGSHWKWFVTGKGDSND